MVESSSRQGYAPALPYSDKEELEPDRIIIPPPQIDYSSGKPSFTIDQALPFEHGSADCGNPLFLRSIVNCHKLVYDHKMLSWKYEGRRDAQEILPFILLGPATVAKDAAFIQQAGVTFMLAVRDAKMAQRMPRLNDPARFPSSQGLVTATFDLSNAYDLVRHVRPVMKMINDHLEQSATQVPINSVSDIRAKVLVFCESGNERSAVVVVAYIMIVYGLNAITALQAVQSQRFCINAGEDMKAMLQTFEELLKAERQVATAHNQDTQSIRNLSDTHKQVPTLNKSKKRTNDMYHDGDEEMEDVEVDVGDGAGRAGVAPYKDSSP